MKSKREIVENWLPRYTNHSLEDFGNYILLTNFNNYVDIFCKHFHLPVPFAQPHLTHTAALGSIELPQFLQYMFMSSFFFCGDNIYLSDGKIATHIYNKTNDVT